MGPRAVASRMSRSRHQSPATTAGGPPTPTGRESSHPGGPTTARITDATREALQRDPRSVAVPPETPDARETEAARDHTEPSAPDGRSNDAGADGGEQRSRRTHGDDGDWACQAPADSPGTARAGRADEATDGPQPGDGGAS